MQNQLIQAMQDINSQIKELDKDLDYLVISELRRQRFFILSTYRYFYRHGYFNNSCTGSQIAVKSMPDTFRITEDSHGFNWRNI